MKDIAATIVEVVNNFAVEMQQMDGDSFSDKRAPGKWSRQEILGHLADSAQNNIQRFVRAQYETAPPKVLYQQDEWVKLGNYQQYSKGGLIHFWIALNIHLCHILYSMDPSGYGKQCMTGDGELRTLTFFAEDYLRHLQLHLDQIKNY